jgi:hypothetical protein
VEQLKEKSVKVSKNHPKQRKWKRGMTLPEVEHNPKKTKKNREEI